jgi:hypothetical protein
MNAWVRAREKVVFNIARILRALTGFVAVRSLNEVRIESSVKLLPFQDQPRKKLHERGVKIARLPLRHPGKKGSSAGPHNAIVSIAQTPESFVKLSVLLMAKCRMIVERHSYNRHTRGDHRSQYWEIIFNLSPKATSLLFVVLGLRLLVIDLLLGKLLLG